MKLSDKILVISKWLESSDNELLVEASEEQLDNLALSLVHASEVLQEAAEEIRVLEPENQSQITPSNLEEMAALAAEFDASDDEILKRQASVLDEILYGLASSKEYIFNFKKAEDDKIDMLKKKYKESKEELDKDIGAKEAVDAIKQAPVFKQYRPLQFELQTRTCPDHAGAQMSRVSEGQFQCSLDHKVYDFGENGYTLLDGTKVPGGSVSEQTPSYHNESHQIFDNRDGRLGINRD